MIGYCTPCATGLGCQAKRDAVPVQGTCAICAQPASVLGRSSYERGLGKLDAAALRAKLQRAQPLTTP